MIELYYRVSDQPRADAHALLASALGRPAGELRHDAAGRPFFDGGPQISLSHTKTAAAAAVSRLPVGVDVEAIRPVKPELARRVMSPAEYSWYVSRGMCPADFFTLWTLKESYYKYLGTGLPGFPNQTAFVLEDGAWRLEGKTQRFFVLETKNLLIAVCGDEQEIRCCSESSD